MISWSFRKPRALISVSVCMTWIHSYCLIGWFWPIRQYDSPLQLCHSLVPHNQLDSNMSQPIHISYSTHACKPSPKSFPSLAFRSWIWSLGKHTAFKFCFSMCHMKSSILSHRPILALVDVNLRISHVPKTRFPRFFSFHLIYFYNYCVIFILFWFVLKDETTLKM